MQSNLLLFITVHWGSQNMLDIRMITYVCTDSSLCEEEQKGKKKLIYQKQLDG